MHLPRAQFEHLVAEAIDGLPEEFLRALDNVEFVVEEHPGPDDHGERGAAPGRLLLGVYRGVPLTKRSAFGGNVLPDQITIFQSNIERVCRSDEEIVREVRRTVLHEIAHHLGISDPRLRELGY